MNYIKMFEGFHTPLFKEISLDEFTTRTNNSIHFSENEKKVFENIPRREINDIYLDDSHIYISLYDLNTDIGDCLIHICIFKCDDDWFPVSISYDDRIKHYLCDEFNGVISLLSRETTISSI